MAGHSLFFLAVLALLAVSRIQELRLSRRNERRMRARGGREAPGGHFSLFVALHAFFPLALIAEVAFARTQPDKFWPLWLLLWGVGEGARRWSMRSLGDRWSARVFVVPGEPRVCRGPYRWLAHPNYIGVALELAAVPLLFGAWRTALVVGVANTLLLSVRVRAENRALLVAERATFDPDVRSE